MKKIPQKTPRVKLSHPRVQLAMSSLLFVIAILMSRSAEMVDWEVDLFISVYSWPAWLHPFFIAATQFGSIYMLGLLLIIYLFKSKYHIVLRLLLSGTLAYTAAGVAKDLWGRMRPHEFLSDVVSLEYMVKGPGFPSGHMALATVLAFTLGHYVNKKYYLLLVLMVISVGLSRIYLGVHAPLDILGGFALGWMSYSLFRHVRFYDIIYGRKAASRPKKSKS